ncbi:MAG: glycosyl transferase family 2, partial [Kordiimonadales bacterium]
LRHWVSWIARYPVPDINSGFRVFRRDIALKYIGILPDSFSFTTTITLAMLTNYHRVKYEPINYRARVGKSKIKPIRDTLRFIMLILRTGTYFAPLRVFFPLIAIMIMLATASLIYDITVLRNLTDKTVLLYLFSMNTGMFALLADMIDKRSK